MVLPAAAPARESAPARLVAYLRQHREVVRWTFIGVMFAQLVLVIVADRITDVARYIREPASLLVLVVIIVWLVVSLDGKDPGRNVFTNGRGTGSFLSLVLVLAFSVGLGLFDLDIASPVAPLIALAVIGLAGTVWYLLDRRTIRRDGPYAFAPPPSPDLPVGIRVPPGARLVRHDVDRLRAPGFLDQRSRVPSGIVRTMALESRHISTHIDRLPDGVYEFASDPANLPQWAPGLCSSVEQVDGQWIAETGMGRIVLSFAPRNLFGVLDHDVTLPSGEIVHNPMRVMPDGTGCEVVFSLRRQPGVSDDEFDRDAVAVLADLTRLKQLLERT